MELQKALLVMNYHRYSNPDGKLTILEWVQCFSIYFAVIAKKHPQQIPGLLAYQTLIESQIEY